MDDKITYCIGVDILSQPIFVAHYLTKINRKEKVQIQDKLIYIQIKADIMLNIKINHSEEFELDKGLYVNLKSIRVDKGAVPKCRGCYFESFPYSCYCNRINCTSNRREDKTDIILIEI